MAEKAEFIRIAMQECGIGRKKAECLYVCGMRYLPAHETLHQRLNETDAENDRLLQEARSLVIQLHATYGNTELHEDCQHDLAELENKHEQQ